MRPGLYYFAHIYSADTEEGRICNYKLCCRRSAKLLLKGYNIFSPITHSHPIEAASPEMLLWSVEKRWQFWIDIDMALLEYIKFTGAIFAPLWGKSAGCMREYDWFLFHRRSDGKPYEILQYNKITGD